MFMMNGMGRLLLTSAALFTFISSALVDSADAADMATKMPVKAPPVPRPAYDWSVAALCHRRRRLRACYRYIWGRCESGSDANLQLDHDHWRRHWRRHRNQAV